MRGEISLILLTCFCIPVLGQEIDTDRFKVWDQHELLEWTDYVVDSQRSKRKYGFATNANTSYQYFYLPKELNLDSCLNVLTVFRKRTSWVNDTSSEELLEHERIHFDIGELYARKMRKQLHCLSAEHHTLKDVYTLLDSLFKEGSRYQDQYDRETFYGRSSSIQIHWRNRIDAELRQLEEFSFEDTCIEQR